MRTTISGAKLGANPTEINAKAELACHVAVGEEHRIIDHLLRDCRLLDSRIDFSEFK